MTQRSEQPISVSVVIPTYNRSDLITASLDSILAQTRPPDSVIVVDDGSSDNTPAILAEYGDRITRIEKANGGKSSALNIAIASVDSDYVWIFDDDDIALPDGLAAHVDHLATHPDTDFTYSPKYVFHGEFSSQAIASSAKPSLPDMTPGEFYLRTMEGMHTMMQGMVIDRRCFDAVGFFDETYIRAQDHEFLLRLARRFDAGYVDTPLFAMRLHDGPRGSSDQSHAAHERAHVWAGYRKHMFRQLRDDLSLETYINGGRPGGGTEYATVAGRRVALAQRGCVMVLNGLEDEAIEDFDQWRVQIADEPMTARERWLLTRTTFIEDMDIVPARAFYSRLGRALSGRSDITHSLLRGLYWTARRETAHRALGNVSALAARGTTLAVAAHVSRAPRR